MSSLTTKRHRLLDRLRLEALWKRAFIVLLFASLTLLVFSRVQDYDFFWHIANGKAMVEQGRIVNEEIFSYTRPGVPFSNHEWLAQIVFYLIFRSAGPLGIVIFKTLLILVLAFFLYRTARLNGSHSLLPALLVVIVILMGIERYRERPEIFSLLFLGLMGYILFGYTGGRVTRRGLSAIPLILVIWDFLHGAVFGVLYLSCFVAGETIKYFIHRGDSAPQHAQVPQTRATPRDLWVISLFALLAMLINPYGLRSYDIFLEFLRGGRLVKSTLEFSPPDFKLYPAFWAFFVLVAGLTLVYRKKLDLTRILVLIPFALLALRYRRVIPFFGLASVPALAYIASLIMERTIAAKWSRRLVPAAGFALIIYIFLLKFFFADNPYTFGYEVNGRLLPVGSARYLAQSELKGNMYNPGHFGGYLAYYLYPERRIFLYNHHVVFGDFPSVITNKNILQEFGVEYAVLERYWGDSASYGKVFTPDQWVPVFLDDASVIVVRNTPENGSFIESNGLRFFTPHMMYALENYSADPGLIERYESDPQVMLLLAKEISYCLRFYSNRLLADYLGYLTLRLKERISDAAAIWYIKGALVYNDSSAYLWIADSVFHNRIGDSLRAQHSMNKASTLDRALVGQWTGQQTR